jgi:hypothetical protein
MFLCHYEVLFRQRQLDAAQYLVVRALLFACFFGILRA